MPGTDRAIEEQSQEDGGKLADRVPVNVFENVSAGETLGIWGIDRGDNLSPLSSCRLESI